MNSITLEEIAKNTVNIDDLTNSIMNYGNSDLFTDYIDGKYVFKASVPDSKEIWQEVATAIGCSMGLDYVNKYCLKDFCDEELNEYKQDILAYRNKKTCWTEDEFNSFLTEIENNFERNISLFQKYLHLIRAERLIDRIRNSECKEVFDKTAESFIEKSDAEFEKIIKATANDMVSTYTIEDVSKLAGESVQTVRNFCQLKNIFDSEFNPATYGIIEGYVLKNGFITERGKRKIVKAFYDIHSAEKGVKTESVYKVE